jgi:hypothetical protein
MEQFIKELRTIESDVFNNLSKASQKIIDVSQEATQQFDRDYTEEPIKNDELGAFLYDLHLLQEIWNPTLEFDVEILNRIEKLANELDVKLFG